MVPPDFVTQIAECTAGPVTLLNGFSIFSFDANCVAGINALHPRPGVRLNPDVRFMGTDMGLIILQGAEFKAQRQRHSAGSGVNGYFFNRKPEVHSPVTCDDPVD